MHIILAFLPYLFQLLLIIHAIKNAKPFLWLYLLIFIPYVGGIAYIILEIIPELMRGGTVDRIGSSLSRTVNPGKPLRELEALVKRQGTVANKVKLADAYVQCGRYEEAVTLYDECLTGPFSKDAEICMKKTKALFEGGKIQEAKAFLDEFRAGQKDTFESNSPETVILCMMVDGNYEGLKDMFFRDSNFEAGFRCAEYFHSQGNDGEVAAILDEMTDSMKTYRYLRKTDNNFWYKSTKRLLKK